MCGIAGHVTAAPYADARALHRQLTVLDHRGPDSRGYYTNKHAAIGTTRLAVIDLESGDPPLVNESKQIVAALNGEIYNYQPIRADLVAAGHRFRSVTDTEVLAHLYEDAEPRALAERLEGMFACAIWDDSNKRLVLIRDRAGKKPLYYWQADGLFVFGSEIKAVLAHPRVPRRVDLSNISDYLVFGYLPTPQTSFEKVVSLPPGHLLVLDPGRPAVLEQYWTAPSRHTPSVDSSPARAKTILTDAVRRRLRSDVPLGAFLSGGVDSSAVVAIASGLVETPLQTFTIGFDDTDGFDERSYARLVAKRFGTQHHEVVVKPNAVDLLERLVWHYDGPFGDSSAIPTFLLSEATREHVTVALSGDGGDELFAGYTRFLVAHYSNALRRIPPSMLSVIGRAIGLLPHRYALAQRAHRFTTGIESGMPRAFMEWLSYSRPEERAELLGRPLASARGPESQYELAWRSTEAAGNTLDRLLRLNFATYLADDLLMKVDRMSMAHGLEVRSPFLDRELVEWAFSIPARRHVSKGRGKFLLRQAMVGMLPEEVLRRSKRGFGVPLDRWFRQDLRTYLQHQLGSPTAKVKELLQPAAVDAAIDTHLANRDNKGHLLWALLSLEVFLRAET